MVWSKDINPFIESDTQLFETPAEQLNLQIEPIGVKFAGGNEIKLLEELPEE